MKLRTDVVLTLVRPLYVISQSGFQWHLTYSNHHTTHLNMFRSGVDLSVLIRRDVNQLTGVVIVQVDDGIAI